MYRAVVGGGGSPGRFETAAEAIEQADPGTGVLLLADGYPTGRTLIGPGVFEKARLKRLRLLVEFPESVPGVQLGATRRTTWERVVVASDALGPDLPKLRILAAHDCHFAPARVVDGASVGEALLVVARVAGYDTAVYGLPDVRFPVLLRTSDGTMVATTKLSNFITARYGPTGDWPAVWRFILSKLQAAAPPRLVAEPRVRPVFGKDEPLPANAEAHALRRFAAWYGRSRLIIPAGGQERIHRLLAGGTEIDASPAPGEPAGDGSLGMLEGFASQIRHTGDQPRRTPLRADCHGEAAMVLALDGVTGDDPRRWVVARNLLDYVYSTSDMHAGVRGDPAHPAYGLIAWGTASATWRVANYGDDNARCLLGTMMAAACLRSGAWDAAILKALLANLRTTGRHGFRGDRIDVPELEKRGWKAYHDAETVNYALNFEAYPWACFLWAYRATAEREFLDKAKTAIRMTYKAYPDGWRWKGNMERARFLLPLAWLVRVEDTPEHRGWLRTVAADLLKHQHPCGAIAEQLVGTAAGHYVIPATNEAYGTTETPLIQSNGDPVSDQLYTTGFALFGLHEAAAATGDAEMKAAEDRLAAYLVRIQVRSETLPHLDGAWFRAFDYGRWDYWASSADVGWGAWSVETGWGPAWVAATLALRARKTSFWELTAGSGIAAKAATVRKEMAVNEGGPWGGR